MHGLQDNSQQVRQNCVFGLGELVLHSGAVAYTQFPTILSALSVAVAQEEHPSTLDNICGALARLILTNFQLIPLEQVLPVFVQKLPLREDFAENLSIFKSFAVLWTQKPDTLSPILDGVIMVGLHVLHRKQYSGEGSGGLHVLKAFYFHDLQFSETRNVILNLLQEIRLRYGERFDQLVNSDATVAAFVQSW